MNREKYREYFEILEVPIDSSFEEVKKSYKHLKKLYSKDSFVFSPIEKELSDEEKTKILIKIEEAYLILETLFFS